MECIIIINAEFSPIFAFGPVSELVQGDDRMRVIGPVIEAIPINKDSHGGNSNIQSDDQISDKDPTSDDLFIMFSGRFFHAFRVRRVKGKGGRGKPVCD